jgi:hypothetical protein
MQVIEYISADSKVIGRVNLGIRVCISYAVGSIDYRHVL